MNLTTKVNGEIFPFEVILFRHEQEQRLFFFIITQDRSCIVAEKTTVGCKWHQVSGDVFEDDLKQAIFREIDNAPLSALLENEQPFEQMEVYLDQA